MPFHVCYYHVVWATKNREALLLPKIEGVAISAIVRKSVELECPVLAINGVPDHIHVAVSISTKLAVTEWIRNVKGYSTHEVNAMFPELETRFAWQIGYGVLTFGAKALPFVSEYIACQKEHHRDNALDVYLEQTEE